MCQLFKKGKKFDRPLKKRVNINVPAMTKISMDIKHMPTSHGYSYILVLLCEVSNYYASIALTLYKEPPYFTSVSEGLCCILWTPYTYCV